MNNMKNTNKSDRLESIYRIYARSAKTILKVNQIQNTLIRDIFAITGDMKSSISIVTNTIKEQERDMNITNFSIQSNASENE